MQYYNYKLFYRCNLPRTVIGTSGGSWDLVHCLASIAVQAHFPLSSVLTAYGSPLQQLPDIFTFWASLILFLWL